MFQVKIKSSMKTQKQKSIYLEKYHVLIKTFTMFWKKKLVKLKQTAQTECFMDHFISQIYFILSQFTTQILI